MREILAAGYAAQPPPGVTAFCRIRSYFSTMQKQGHPMLSALTAVFHDQPLPVAWEPEQLRKLAHRVTIVE
jgi:hypothetical protein